MRRVLFIALVGSVITLNLLPAWNIHVVPKSIRRVFEFRHFGTAGTEFELFKRAISSKERRKEIGLALKERFDPGDSIVAGGIGVLGYYSGLRVYDRFGLIDRHVAMLEPEFLRFPGHDIKAPISFFYADNPTIIRAEVVGGPPPSRKNPKWPLNRRIREKADAWREWNPRAWKRYVPEVIALKRSEDGSENVLLILRLIEEEPPHVASLPRDERVAFRKERARKEWAKFYHSLESW